MFAILIYGFPLVLLLFEWGLRTLMLVDTSGFTGPTLAAAGLSFLVPLAKPKELSIAIPDTPNVIAVSKADNHFVAVTWIFILVFLFVWSAACYKSIKAPLDQTFGIATHLAIGSVAYLISLVMIFIKEKV